MEIYFEYEDDEQDKYYYNVNTKETTYEFPYNGKIFNPYTRKLIYKPRKSKLNEYHSTPLTKLRDIQSNPVNDNQFTPQDGTTQGIDITIPDSKKKKHHKHRRHHDRESLPVKNKSVMTIVRNNSLLEINVGVQLQMEAQAHPKPPQSRKSIVVNNNLDTTTSLLSGINDFKTPEFAQKFFQRHRVTGIFSRREVPVGELISFTNKPLKEPLLSNLPSACKKFAVSTFDCILQYTGVAKSRAPQAAVQKLYTLVSQHPEIRDEAYFQLVKQTTDCPDNNALKLGWELFLIMASIFPSSRNSENYILAHIARTVTDNENDIGEIAHFTYIRFEARCCIGTESTISPTNILKIPSDIRSSHNSFGCTLSEIMWGQRFEYPKLPIPYVLYLMISEIIAKNGYSTEGLFRLPGNLKRVREVAETEANDSLECIKNLPLHDVASLLKQWFRELPNPVVPYIMTDALRKADEDKNLMDFVESLQNTHKYTLMYLIGFLQECATHSNVTLMYDKNLAIVFGPNVVQINSNEPGRIQLFSKIANDFVLFLIQNWDTSEIYPLEPDYLKKD